MTTVVYRLVGFDRTTEMVAVEYDLPKTKLDVFRQIVRPNPSDKELVYSYPLDASQVSDIAHLAGLEDIQPDLDYFFEAVAVKEPVTA